MRTFSTLSSALLLILCASALAETADTVFPGAPAAPEGFESYEKALQAVLGGKVPLINPKVEIPETVVETLGIEYAKHGDASMQLDLYTPKESAAPVPGLIFIHGGGWRKGSRTDYKVYTIHFANLGYAAATISYRLLPDNLFPCAVEDAKSAVRWMRANAEKYNIDPKRIAVIGGSAGGHLSMMVGYTGNTDQFIDPACYPEVSGAVQAVVDFYGPCDLTMEAARTAPSVVQFIGKPYEEAANAYAAASPITHLTKSAPPTLILHGTIDELVPIAQSDMLAAKLEQLGVPCVYDKIEGWPHTMDMAQGINDRARFMMEQFFAKYLAPPALSAATN